MNTQDNPSLRALLGAPVAVPIGSVTLQIAPMGWHQAAMAIEPVLPMAESLPALLAGAPAEGGDDRMARVVGLVIVWRDALGEFLAAATKLPRDDVLALPPPYMAELLLAVLEINADFFVRSLPGLVERASGRLEALRQRMAPALEQMSGSGGAAATAAASPGSTTSSSA